MKKAIEISKTREGSMYEYNYKLVEYNNIVTEVMKEAVEVIALYVRESGEYKGEYGGVLTVDEVMSRCEDISEGNLEAAIYSASQIRSAIDKEIGYHLNESAILYRVQQIGSMDKEVLKVLQQGKYEHYKEVKSAKMTYLESEREEMGSKSAWNIVIGLMCIYINIVDRVVKNNRVEEKGTGYCGTFIKKVL